MFLHVKWLQPQQAYITNFFNVIHSFIRIYIHIYMCYTRAYIEVTILTRRRNPYSYLLLATDSICDAVNTELLLLF